MNITFTAKTIVEADNYLTVEYEDKQFTLNEFANTYSRNNDEFYLDSLLKKCILVYKGRRLNYGELCFEINEFANSLEFLENYSRLYPIENQIFIVDRDYYAALKMVESVEKNLMYARYALIKSYCIIDFNINTNWNAGYAGVYNFRCIEANNAIMWYNTIYDTMLQIVFFAFGLYKKHSSYNDSMDFHKLLKLCDNNFLGELYSQNKSNIEFVKLWKILNKGYNKTSKIREWTNYIKHKGGVKYIGASAENPFSILIDTEKKIYDSDFEQIKLELDYVVLELQNAHKSIVGIVNELVEFLNFQGATLINDGENSSIPNAKIYKKVIL